MQKEKNLNQALDQLEKVVASWAEMSIPTIKPKLVPGKGFVIRLEEIRPESSSAFYQSGVLDKMVDWTSNELIKWKGVTRISWDMWKFSSKKEAEKFIVYYNLKWEQ